MGLAWIMSKLRIVLFSFLPAQFLLLIVLGLVAVAYMGYQRITGADLSPTARRRPPSSPRSPFSPSEPSIDDELEALRRDLDNES